MELIRIDEGKLKIILTHEDLAEFEMDESELDYANTETKRMFWELLRRAKHTTGFDTDGHRVLVQLYPSREGGCELFVTKIGILPYDCHCIPEDEEDFDCDSDEISDDEEEDDVNLSSKHSCRHSACGGHTAAFGFDSLDAMLCVCRRLLSMNYSGNSEAYRSDHGRYYLFFEKTPRADDFLPNEYSFLNEYGTSESGEELSLHLSEHGKLLCASGAIARLGIL